MNTLLLLSGCLMEDPDGYVYNDRAIDYHKGYEKDLQKQVCELTTPPCGDGYKMDEHCECKETLWIKFANFFANLDTTNMKGWM